MKKKLIAAGAASLAVAAMPIVGVFADDITSVTDDINVTIDASCSFLGESVKTGTTYGKTYTDEHVAVGTQADFNGDTEGKGGAHDFTVFCNDDGGWRVSASEPGVLHDSAQGDATHDFVYQNSAITAAGVEGKWSAAVSGTAASSTISGYIPAAGGVIAGEANETATAGSTFTVTYAAWAGTQSAAGTYSGEVTYTLAHPQTPAQQTNP